MIPWWSRIGLAFGVFFRILFDGRFAETLGAPASRSADPVEPAPATPAVSAATATAAAASAAAPDAALLLLAMLQAEGRFVDFVQQDISAYPDADVGAVARVVQSGCRQVLRSHLRIEPIRGESEGQPVTLEPGFDPSRIKLTGNVGGSGRMQGVLKHRGWQATEIRLPTSLDLRASSVLCPAEVEL
jgi:hypothetical protein